MTTSWSQAQKFVLGILILLCINYIAIVVIDKQRGLKTSLAEGFEGTPTIQALKPEDNSLQTWISDSQLIQDDFQAGVYDQLCQQGERSQAKVELLKSIWSKDEPNLATWSILDAGCGTGWPTASFAKSGVGRLVGLDNSMPMIKQAQTKTMDTLKVTPEQQKNITWRKDTLGNPSACSAGEFSHAYCFQFSIQYLPNQEEFFRTMNLWVKQGGKLCVEVVNKQKFDPILESASPFVGFSLQKQSKDRMRKSRVTFDKFDQDAEFVLTDPKAEFQETFRFKNGHVRRQKHVFHMPKIEEIVVMAKRAGWKQVGSQDLNPLGFEYGYLLLFEKA